MLRRLRGHVLTVAPTVRHALRPEPVPPSIPWRARVDDALRGPVTLFGHLHEHRDADEAVIVIHGLGGSPDSYYVRRAASVIVGAGKTCLRLGLRGAARAGEDFSHGGLTTDIHAALAAPELARYRRLYIVGYSMGGHATLRLAAEAHDARLASVAAICSPLDLAATCVDIDQARALVYRAHLLRNMREIYSAVAARHGGPVSPEDARRIRTFIEWDERITAPRWGFSSAAHYYQEASAARVLDQLRIPALLVAEKRDPMVKARSLAPHVARPRGRLAVRWTDSGGHVGYPRSSSLRGPRSSSLRGLRAGTMESQVLDWLERAAAHS